MFKKNKISIPFFVIGSLGALFIIGIMIALIQFISFSIFSESKRGVENYYFSQNPDNLLDDPLITKLPTLDEILQEPLRLETDPRIGDDSEKLISIFMFSDYSCDYCYQAEKEILELWEEYADKISYTWKDYPGLGKGLNSLEPAIAGRCAGKQGYFWVFHEELFKHNKNLDREQIIKIADDLNLDMDEFTKCIDKDEGVKELILDNMYEADALDISGVPMIYINGKKVDADSIVFEIEKEIKDIK